MKFSDVPKFLALTLMFSVPVLVSAQIQTKRVTFPAGKSSTYISGTIKGRQTIDYTVSAKAGQQMQVSMNSKHGALYFNVLPPGSNDVAIFIGQTEGNKFDGTLSVSGTYKIRVYLMASAARRNETANFGLNIGIPASTASTGSTTAKLSGTGFTATGQVQAARGNAKKGSDIASFGVYRRSDGTAELHLLLPGSIEQRVKFNSGEWKCIMCRTISYSRVGDEWELLINGNERFYIPDAVLYGG